MLIFRVGQNCIYTPYMTVYLVISLPSVPYMHRINMVLANPTHFWPHLDGDGSFLVVVVEAQTQDGVRGL